MRVFIRVLLLVLVCSCAYGQNNYSLNFNINNGLPSNHIYDILRDSYGYLWVATPDGVARYNGYDWMVFDVSNGLPTNDIWGLTEDKQKRVWLWNISNEIGYLQHEEYHRVKLRDNSKTIYPQQLRLLGNSVIFTSPNLDKRGYPTVCIEDHDTIRTYTLPTSVMYGHIRVPIDTPYNTPHIFIGKSGETYLFVKQYLFKVAFANGTMNMTQQAILSDTLLCDKLLPTQDFITGNFLIKPAASELTSNFKYVDLNSGACGTINVEQTSGIKEPIYYIYFMRQDVNNNKINVITQHYVVEYEVSNAIKLSKIYKKKDIIKVDDNINPSSNQFFKDTIWGTCMGTQKHGLWVNYNVHNNFSPEVKHDLKNYSYIGGATDESSYWWNPSTATLMKIDKQQRFSTQHLDFKNEIYQIKKYNQDTFLLMGSGTDGTHLFIDRKNNAPLVQKTNLSTNILSSVYIGNMGYHISTNMFYASRNNSTIADIDRDRYKGLAYNPISRQLWAYNQYKVFIHTTGKDSIIPTSQLEKMGINKVQKILIGEQYGNVFVKDMDHILLYDSASRQFKSVYNYVNVLKASIYIYKDIFIVAGKFGISFSKILDAGRLSAPIIYPNIKNINYKYIDDVQISNNKLLINTDNGAYWIDVPANEEYSNTAKNKQANYNLVLYYNENAMSVASGDTVIRDQKNQRLEFDIINPNGNGRLWFRYKIADIDTNWVDMNSYELNIPSSLIAGTYYKVDLQAYDDVWVGAPKSMYLYIEPLWWQQVLHHRSFGIVLGIFIAGFIALIIFITNKIVTANNKKRNLRLELELKSIYSQINPHFVFNTLGAVMYLIKKKKLEEAYDHVSKFSKLLRAYIKSSRNKYNTIAEETENLENYIQLQQARFENKFDHKIVVAKDIEANKVKIPALLLQPIVENAIDHGLFHKESRGHLLVEFKKTPHTNEIVCIVDDDGIGRQESEKLSKNSLVKTESYGETLIADLITIFNQYEQMSISISYKDKVAPLTGTTVVISIKNPAYEA